MKRIICIVFSIVIGVVSFAQGEHLTFKSIPLSGSASDFKAKMKQAGFTLEKETDRAIVMSGPFASFNNCTVFVGLTPKSKTVWKVRAYLPEQVSWSSTKSRYLEFKEKFTMKYGIPKNSYEFFTDSYYEGDGYELQAIKYEKGYYVTFWDLPLGTVVVEIDAKSNSDANVVLGYEDKQGAEQMQKEADEIVIDDI